MATSRIAKPAVAATTDAPASAIADQDALSVSALAKGVLARDFRPRAASIRRLAEAVLAKDEVKPKKKKNKSATKKTGKSADKASAKKRRLAKIPGQKGKKKKG